MKQKWIIAGTENELVKYAPEHVRSNLPELHGCDVLIFNTEPSSIIGFQRKEVNDFISSLSDGRLVKEIGQIKSSSLLSYSVLILEGNFIWTTEGKLATGYSPQFTKTSLRSIITGIQIQGILFHSSTDIRDTVNLIHNVSTYLSKSDHSSLSRRPKTDLKNSWGRVTNEAFAIHLLQSWPGIGPNTAKAIFNHFGKVPLLWETSMEELQSISGIGKDTARKLIESLADITTSTRGK